MTNHSTYQVTEEKDCWKETQLPGGNLSISCILHDSKVEHAKLQPQFL